MTAVIRENKDYIVRFEFILNRTENFIYYSTRGLKFENLNPEFKRIMEEEFLVKDKKNI